MEKAQQISPRKISPHDTVVRVGRASIPCNPNTIYNVGNLKNPVYLIQAKTDPEEVVPSARQYLKVPNYEKPTLARAGTNPKTAF
jgi:hypothetical protein